MNRKPVATHAARLVFFPLIALGFTTPALRMSAAPPRITLITVDPATTKHEQVLDYDVLQDPDLPYVASSTAPAETAFDADLKVNDNAQVGRARVMPVVLAEERIGMKAQGADGVRAYTFAHWQYIDRLVAWGGTSARNVTAPGQAWIDAAHRNGVKIYGNIFLAPRAYGGRISHLEYLVQIGEDGSFPVADRLIQIAQAQGFDGWFINQEAQGADAAMAERLGAMLEYIQARSDIEIIWYDAMTERGTVRWQNALNEQNDRFFQHQGRRVSDAVFLDFGATEDGLTRSRSLAQHLGRDPYDLYAGALVEARGIAGGDDLLNLVLDQPGPHLTSVALFRPDNEAWGAYKQAWKIEDMIRAAQRMYVGAKADPSDTAQVVPGTAWHGMAHHIAAKTPLTTDRFVSHFNYGIGYAYYVNGERLSEKAWSNMGAQDVLPTWRWVLRTQDPTPLAAAFDFTDALHGGACLRVSGSLDAPTDMPLYLTALAVHDDTRLVLSYKTGRPGPVFMRALVTFQGDAQTPITLDLPDTTDAGWQHATLDLGAHAGRTLSSLGLRFEGDGGDSYQIRLGRIGVIRGEPDTPAPPTNPRLDGPPARRGDGVYEARLRWNHSADHARDAERNNLFYYNVYQRFDDGRREHLGVTAGEGYWINDLAREQGADAAHLIVEAVSLEFGVSQTQLVVPWNDTTPPGAVSG